MMQRLIILLICVLAIALTWANIALAQTGADLATGREKAAAGDVKGALAVYEEVTRTNPYSADAFAHLGPPQEDPLDAAEPIQHRCIFPPQG